MENQKIAENLNILGQFCGKRDVEELNQKNLHEKYGIEKADVMVLFGGSILAGGDVLAKAIKDIPSLCLRFGINVPKLASLAKAHRKALTQKLCEGVVSAVPPLL